MALELDLGKVESSGAFTSYMNLVSTICGAGILGLPFAYAHTGYILGSFLLFLCGVFAFVGLHLTSVSARMARKPVTFKSVADLASPHLATVIDTAVLTKCFGVACAYLIVVGDLMPQSIEYLFGLPIARELCVLLGFFIAAPLSFYHQLDALKYSSSVSMIFILILVVVTVIYSPLTSLDPCQSDECTGDILPFPLHARNVLRVLSIFVFGFTCHQNAYAIVNELKHPSQYRYDNVFGCAVLTGGIFYLIVGVSAYSTYGDDVQSNILKSYPRSATMSICKLLICFVEILHFPLQINPGRRALLTLISAVVDDSSGYQHTGEVAYNRYIRVTFFLLLSALFVALTVSDFGLILEIIGATGSTLISYILPGVTFLLIFKLDPGERYIRVDTTARSYNMKGISYDNDNEIYNDDEDDNSNNRDMQEICNPVNRYQREIEPSGDNIEVHSRDLYFVSPVFTYEELVQWRYLAWILVVSGSFIMPCCLYMAFKS